MRSFGKQTLGVILGSVIGLLLGAVLWAKAAPRQEGVPEVLRAHQFEVVDKQGRTRATFGISSISPEQARKMGLKGKIEGVMLALYQQSAQNQPIEGLVMLGAYSNGGAVLSLANVKNASVALGANPDGSSNITLWSHGKRRIIKP